MLCGCFELLGSRFRASVFAQIILTHSLAWQFWADFSLLRAVLGTKMDIERARRLKIARNLLHWMRIFILQLLCCRMFWLKMPLAPGNRDFRHFGAEFRFLGLISAVFGSKSAIKRARRLEIARNLFQVMRICSAVVLSYWDPDFELPFLRKCF